MASKESDRWFFSALLIIWLYDASKSVLPNSVGRLGEQLDESANVLSNSGKFRSHSQTRQPLISFLASRPPITALNGPVVSKEITHCLADSDAP